MTDASSGADQMRAVGRELKELGDKKLKREFTKALTASALPLKAELPPSARQTLPKRGGLAEYIAKSQIRVTRRADGGVRVSARGRYQLGRMDEPGVVRHPVFKRKGEEGRRTVWQTQKIQPGWFTRPAEANRPIVQRNMLKAADEMTLKLRTMREAT